MRPVRYDGAHTRDAARTERGGTYGPDDDPPPLDPADIALPIRIRHQGTELTLGTAFDITLADVAVGGVLPRPTRPTN
ncbi:hypothetical protein [Spongiactinospora sp. 9N601]|uniref:hypothetical protein n=1 Tax=Spongiactinospora sp. 9N601 TaxID=3375149 RepID=UPI0037B91C2C